MITHSISEENSGFIMMRSVDAIIPDAPRFPFPVHVNYCEVVNGFGRGSSELGIPTANVDIDELPAVVNDELSLGVYFGFCKLRENNDDLLDKSVTTSKTRADGRVVEYNYGQELAGDELEVLPVVLSVGVNPFYNDASDPKAAKTVELHILHEFGATFYGSLIKFNILGYIRPELNYTSREQLVADINIDIEVAKRTLLHPNYLKHKDLL